MLAITAHFDGKVIVPDEPVDLPAGQPLVLHIELKAKGKKALSALEWIAANRIKDDNLPSDLAYNLDHYLYGTPKKRLPRRKSRKK
jgi:hypothetical protein